MARRKKRKLSKKEKKAIVKAEATRDESQMSVAQPMTRSAVQVQLPKTVTVAELANRSGRAPAEIVSALLRNGVIAGINESIDRETAEIIADEIDITVAPEEAAVVDTAPVGEGKQVARPPVVTVLGHVDHGKTTLLDAIRQSDVTATESGGITQHIGAYQVSWSNKDGDARLITFIDTPGHEAFSAMRAHGATITDIAILVVAADEGVKPQTKEALSHARAAEVPVVVALTKMDKPGANVEKVKGELSELGVQPEEWGGKTPVVAVSAKAGEGIDELLETILLVADLGELSARDSGPARGIAIEAHKAPGTGPVATVLIQEGTLEVGDTIVVGASYGRVRFLEDEHKQRLKEAGPAKPVRLAGLSSVPGFGDRLQVVESERTAKAMAQDAMQQQATRLPGTFRVAGDTLPVVLKGDVDGSVAALVQSIEAIEVEGMTVSILLAGVGDVTESDIHMAIPDQAIVLAFRTKVTPTAKQLARTHGVTVKTYDVIYELLDDVQAAAKGALRTELVPVEVGKLKVLGVFRTTKETKIVGGRVEEGRAAKQATVQVLRNGELVGSGTVQSLQRGQTAADEVAAGEQCGLSLSIKEPVAVDDVVVFSVLEERVVRSTEQEDEKTSSDETNE